MSFVVAAAVALVMLQILSVLERIAARAVTVLEHRYSAEHMDREERMRLDREIFERVHPKTKEPIATRAVAIPPDIEAQLTDAPEWEREDTRARALELFLDLERQRPDDKPADLWGRVHKLLELETEAVESSI